MPHRVLVRRVGSRGEALILLGAVWAWVGLGVLMTPVTVSPDLALWHALIPAPWRAAGWIITGAAAIITGATRRGTSSAVGGLMLMPLIHFTSYMWAWIESLFPGPPAGLAAGWFSAAFYVLMLGIVVNVAHMPPLSFAEQVAAQRRGQR